MPVGEAQTRNVEQLAEMRVVRARNRARHVCGRRERSRPDAVCGLEAGAAPGATAWRAAREPHDAQVGADAGGRDLLPLRPAPDRGRRWARAGGGRFGRPPARAPAHQHPVAMGVRHLAPVLMEFQRRYPDVRVNLSLTDRVVDFYAEQIDVAVRMGPLSDFEIHVAQGDGDRAGHHCQPASISHASAPRSAPLTWRTIAASSSRRLGAAAGRSRPRTEASSTWTCQPPLPATACNAFCSWRCRGLASPSSPTSWLPRPVRAGELVPLLANQHYIERATVFAVFAPGTQKIPKVRAFLDFLVEQFQHRPWRLAKE